MKKIFILFFICLSLLQPTSASASTCANFNLKKLFFEDYYENSLWQTTNETRQIRWSFAKDYIYNHKITKQMTEEEKSWTREAFNSIDAALNSFEFVETSHSPDIVIGYTELVNVAGFWSTSVSGQHRVFGSIRLRDNLDWWFKDRKQFIKVVQHELGNLMGAGDIRKSDKIDSIFEDPIEGPFKDIELSDFDVKLLKQLYKERICFSVDYTKSYIVFKY